MGIPHGHANRFVAEKFFDYDDILPQESLLGSEGVAQVVEPKIFKSNCLRSRRKISPQPAKGMQRLASVEKYVRAIRIRRNFAKNNGQGFTHMNGHRAACLTLSNVDLAV